MPGGGVTVRVEEESPCVPFAPGRSARHAAQGNTGRHARRGKPSYGEQSWMLGMSVR